MYCNASKDVRKISEVKVTVLFLSDKLKIGPKPKRQ